MLWNWMLECGQNKCVMCISSQYKNKRGTASSPSSGIIATCYLTHTLERMLQEAGALGCPLCAHPAQLDTTALLI